MVYHHCMVPGCTSNSKKWQQLEKYPWMKGVTFLTFPRDTRERRAWIRLSRRSDFKLSNITKWTRICSRHFVDGCVSQNHPRPELFPHNNWKKPIRVRESVVNKLHAQESDSGGKESELRVIKKIKLIKMDRHQGEVAAYVDIPYQEHKSNQHNLIAGLYYCIVYRFYTHFYLCFADMTMM